MGKQKGEKLGDCKEDMFNGDGVTFKCKLFGSLKVSAPRGNVICAETISKLKVKALQLRKDHKEHKQRIFLNISVKGIRIIDEETKKLEHAHLIHRISFICQDGTDKRCFCYIVSLKEGYTLFAFRTEKAAELITNSLKELFDVVFKIYTKQKAEGGGSVNTSAILTNRQPAEEGEEVTENTYDVPGTKHEEHDSHNESETTDDTGKLLDWTELNDNIAIMQTNMKHSDSSDLLADLTNADFENFEPFAPDADDRFFFGGDHSDAQPAGQNQDPFASNPFDPSSGDDAKKAQLASSRSDSNIIGHSPNPFANDQFSPGGSSEVAKSKSMNAMTDASAANNPFGGATVQTQPSGDLHNLDFAFGGGSHLPTTTSQSAAPSTMQQPMGGIFDSFTDSSNDVLAPTVSNGAASNGRADSGDPFASLTSNIDNLRVGMPSSGSPATGFNAKGKSPDPVTLNSLASQSGQSPRPVIPMMQPVAMGMGQQQPRQYGVNPMMPNQQYRQPMNASAHNPFLGMGQAPQQAQYGQPMGMGGGMGSPNMQRPYYVQQANQMNSPMDPSQLYATVDKSTPANDPLAQFPSLQKPSTTQQQNDLAGLDLLQ